MCHLCDSAQFPHSCLNDPNELLETCASEFDKCYTILIENVIHRGCVSARDALFPDSDSLEKCWNPSVGDCETCSGNLCNKNAIFDTCIKCNGSKSTTDHLGEHGPVACSLKEDVKEWHGCYFNITDDTYSRGCVRDLNLKEQRACDMESSQCQSCKYPNCNRKEHFSTECFECNGETDSTCARSVELASRVNCNDYSKICVTGIDANGFTHRGCNSYDLLSSLFPIGFETCSKHLCNHQIFPADRLQCFQCEGTRECVTLKKLHSDICNNYMDQCYAYLENSTCASFQYQILTNKLTLFKMFDR